MTGTQFSWYMVNIVNIRLVGPHVSLISERVDVIKSLMVQHDHLHHTTGTFSSSDMNVFKLLNDLRSFRYFDDIEGLDWDRCLMSHFNTIQDHTRSCPYFTERKSRASDEQIDVISCFVDGTHKSWVASRDVTHVNAVSKFHSLCHTEIMVLKTDTFIMTRHGYDLRYPMNHSPSRKWSPLSCQIQSFVA